MRDSESDYILVMDMEYKRLTDFLGSGRGMLFVKLPVWLVSKVRDIMKLDIVRAGRSETSVGWLFVESSEGFGEAVFGNAETGGPKVIMRDEKTGTFKSRRVEVQLVEGSGFECCGPAGLRA